MTHNLKESGKKRNNFIFVFLAAFFFLYWLPVMLVLLSSFYSVPIIRYAGTFVEYLWIIESDLVFAGHHFSATNLEIHSDSFLGLQAIVASIILSFALALIVVLVQKKFHRKNLRLDTLQVVSTPYFYSLIAKIIALYMLDPALNKFFPNQFNGALLPSVIMTPTGSLNPGGLFWTAYGSSEYYEIILGIIEIIGAILLWIPRTTIFGALITTIVMVNIFIMDIFCGVPFLIQITVVVTGCLVLLWPELKFYCQSFIHRKIEAHTVPIYSFACAFHGIHDN